MRNGKSGWNRREVRTRSTTDRWTGTHVGDVMTSEGDQAALGADRLCGGLRGVPTGSDEHPVSPDLPQEIVRVYLVAVLVVGATDTGFGDVEVGEVREPLFGLRDKVGEGRLRVFHLHRLPGIPG